MRFLSRMVPFFLLLSLLAVVPGVPAAGGISVEGRVLAPGGGPLPGAEVQLAPVPDPVTAARDLLAGAAPEPTVRVKTGPDGRFRLEAPYAGHWAVRVAHEGLVPAVLVLSGLVTQRELPDVTLDADAGLSVRVVTPKDQPLAGALVMALGGDWTRGGSPPGWTPEAAVVRTGSDGTARLAHAEGDLLPVSAWAPGREYVEREIVHGTAMTLRLAPAPTRTIEVRSEESAPIGGVLVIAGERRTPLGFTGAEGRFEAPARAGDGVPVGLRADDGRGTRGRVTPPGEERKPQIFTLPDLWSAAGRVVDADSRRPVAGVLVWKSGDPSRAVVTGEDGGYSIPGRPHERAWLTSATPGYLRPNAFPFAFDKPSGRAPTLPLEPAATLEGVVVDEDGAPVAGTSVTLQVRETPGMFRIRYGSWSRVPETRSNSRGVFVLDPVDPKGIYDLRAHAERFAPAHLSVRGLKPREVRRGIRVVLKRGITAAGSVADTDEQPVAGAEIVLQESKVGGEPGHVSAGSTPLRFEGATDLKGRFEVAGLAAGKYDIEIKAPGFARETAQGLEVPEDADPADLGTFTLEPGVTVQGRVNDTEGEAVEGAQVFVRQARGPFSFGGGRGSDKPDATTGPNGWFAVRDLRRGTTVNLEVKREGYIASGNKAVRVPSPEPVEITMSPASTVAGWVRDPDGNGIPGAGVTLQMTNKAQMGLRAMIMMSHMASQADNEGRFEYTDIRPGEVSLSAVASGWQKTKLDGIEVPKGKDVTDIQLVLKPGAILEGRVLLPDGRPAVEARVRAVEETASPFGLGGARTDGDGFYRLEGLVPGRVSIEANHPEYPRTVKDVELEPGANTLDLELQGGQEVSGMVVDESGVPIAFAEVRLAPVGSFWGGPSGTTGEDGAFSIAGAKDGEYSATAEAQGYAAPDEGPRVRVQGQPVAGVVIRMTRGGAITGTVTGLDPDRYSEVMVEGAQVNGEGYAEARLDHTGRYRLADAAPGTWTVTATLGESGRQATGRVDLEPGSPEAVLDLEFQRGTVLSGRVLEGDRPVAGATVSASGKDVERFAWSRTDADGAFRIEGLVPGTYNVSVQQWETGLSRNETYELSGDLDVTIRIPTQRVLGQVVDATDREPIAGATVTLDPAGTAGPTNFFSARSATTDQAGKFAISHVGEGDWRLTATRKGYAAATRDLFLRHGEDVEDVQIALDPTEGVTLEVRLPSGQPADRVSVAVLDETGVPVVHGDYSTGENGRVRLSSVPEGSWAVLVGAYGGAPATVRVQAPGSVTPVQLPSPCRLAVSVPELAGTGTIAKMTATGADGVPLRDVAWLGTVVREWEVRDGQRQFDSIPPGTWHVQVAAPDGRSWEGTVATTPSAPAELVLQ